MQSSSYNWNEAKNEWLFKHCFDTIGCMIWSCNVHPGCKNLHSHLQRLSFRTAETRTQGLLDNLRSSGVIYYVSLSTHNRSLPTVFPGNQLHWYWQHAHTQPFYGPFSGTTPVSRCQKKSSSALHGAGHHSNRTNQWPTSHIPPFLRQMPFLWQPSQYILAWDRHQICWLAYPVARFIPKWLGFTTDNLKYPKLPKHTKYQKQK